MGHFEYLVEKQRVERRRARASVRAAEIPLEVVVSEWRPAPLDHLGRALWDDIDRYLEFFAITREGEAPVSDHGRARRARAHGLFHV